MPETPSFYFNDLDNSKQWVGVQFIQKSGAHVLHNRGGLKELVAAAVGIEAPAAANQQGVVETDFATLNTATDTCAVNFGHTQIEARQTLVAYRAEVTHVFTLVLMEALSINTKRSHRALIVLNAGA